MNLLFQHFVNSTELTGGREEKFDLGNLLASRRSEGASDLVAGVCGDMMLPVVGGVSLCYSQYLQFPGNMTQSDN